MGTQMETPTTCNLCGGLHENQHCCLLRDEPSMESKSKFQKSRVFNQKFGNSIGAIAKQLSTTLPNAFPSNTKDNPKGECKVITLRSGRALEDVSKKVNVQPTMEKDKEDATKEEKLQQPQQVQKQQKN
ncbi:hypothetical protein PIB30_083053 [Stylosanthes scabra]|uniref:Uncharacterized protein n=1 Tax=Stylosanthes scabra TaxID=79078 RepID=A0ABU6TTK4_9FABA|nr:hypothetical protein [Stylosanthes scabra]